MADINPHDPMTNNQLLYSITELEMRQIQQDCAYPDQESCDGCPLADGEDNTRASGMGCNFIGANRLIDEIMERSHPAPSPDVEMLQRLDAHVTKWMKEVHDPETASKAREKLFEAIRAERDPHLDYVDWDSIEAAYMRTGGEPR